MLAFLDRSRTLLVYIAVVAVKIVTTNLYPVGKGCSYHWIRYACATHAIGVRLRFVRTQINPIWSDYNPFNPGLLINRIDWIRQSTNPNEDQSDWLIIANPGKYWGVFRRRKSFFTLPILIFIARRSPGISLHLASPAGPSYDLANGIIELPATSTRMPACKLP